LEEVINNVKKFFEDDEFSRLCPGARFTKVPKSNLGKLFA